MQEDEIKALVKEGKSWKKKAERLARTQMQAEEMADHEVRRASPARSHRTYMTQMSGMGPHHGQAPSEASRVTRAYHRGEDEVSCHCLSFLARVSSLQMNEREHREALHHPVPVPRTLRDIPSLLANTVKSPLAYAVSF